MYARRRTVEDIRKELIDRMHEIDEMHNEFIENQGTNVGKDISNLVKIREKIAYLDGLRASYDDPVEWYRSETAIEIIVYSFGILLGFIGGASGITWIAYIGFGMILYYLSVDIIKRVTRLKYRKLDTRATQKFFKDKEDTADDLNMDIKVGEQTFNNLYLVSKNENDKKSEDE